MLLNRPGKLSANTHEYVTYEELRKVHQQPKGLTEICFGSVQHAE